MSVFCVTVIVPYSVTLRWHLAHGMLFSVTLEFKRSCVLMRDTFLRFSSTRLKFTCDTCILNTYFHTDAPGTPSGTTPGAFLQGVFTVLSDGGNVVGALRLLVGFYGFIFMDSTFQPSLSYLPRRHWRPRCDYVFLSFSCWYTMSLTRLF